MSEGDVAGKSDGAGTRNAKTSGAANADRVNPTQPRKANAARACLASAGNVLRQLTSTSAWLALGASVVLAAVFAAAVDSASDPWNARGPILTLPLWLPGLWVAIRLRHVLPALGAGDAAIAWVELRAWGRLPLRLGAALGAAVAVLVLTLVGGLAVAASAAAFASPDFAHATQLEPIDPTREDAARSKATRQGVLLRDKDIESFRAPEGPAARLRIEPQYYFGTEAARAGVVLEVSGPGGFGQRLRLADYGSRIEIQVPALPAGVWSFVRVGDSGPPISLRRGRLFRLDGGLSAWLAVPLLALRFVGWGILLLGLTLATSYFLARDIQALCIFACAPLLAFAPQIGASATATWLGRALVPNPLMHWLPLLAGLAGIAVGILPLRLSMRPDIDRAGAGAGART